MDDMPSYASGLRQATPDRIDRPQPQTASQLREYQRQIEQLSVAAQDFFEELDSRRLAECLARRAGDLLGAERTIVRLHRVKPGPAAVLYQGGKISSSDAPPDSRTADAAVARRQAVLIDAAGNEVSTNGSLFATAMAVPIFDLQNEVTATIELVNKRSALAFTERDVGLARCLARLAATAIDRARLFDRMHDWTQSLEMLLSFNAAVNQPLEPKQLVRQLLENATKFLKADGGIAGLAAPTESGPPAFMQCEGHWSQGAWRQWSRVWLPGQGTPGIVMQTEFPYFSSNYAADPSADEYLAEQHRVHLSVCVPIKNKRDKVLGFCELHRHQGEPEFTWQDAAFLESLGNTAAVAIENTRLVKSLELRNREIKKLSADNVHRLEEDRSRVARELHDEAGQVLIGLKLGIQVVRGMLSEDHAQARMHLDDLRIQVNEAATRIKELAKRLRPPTLDELGFEAAIRQLAADFRRRFGINVNLQFCTLAPLPSEVETALYRIAQEAFTNASKHSGSDDLSFDFTQDEHSGFVMQIRDCGCGFDVSKRSDGLGVLGIKERVKMLGGKLRLESQLGVGTLLEVSVADSP